MSERISKVQRWLDLVAYLIGRRTPATVQDIMENVPAYARKWCSGDETDQATARRTFERDKDELREQGIAIETVEYLINYGLQTIEGYRLTRRAYYLPELRLGGATGDRTSTWTDKNRVQGVELSEDEARSALDALRRLMELPASPFAREARSALVKLAFDIDPDRFEPAPVLYVEPPGTADLLTRLGQLSDAVIARKRVSFLYNGIYRGEATMRQVDPYGLFFQYGHWYLVGHDATRGAIRVFRVGRIDELSTNTRAPKTPDFEVPAGFNIDDYLDRRAWDMGDRESPVRAEVLFRYPASLWAERCGHGELVEARDDGSAVRAFELYQADPFLRWLLSLTGDAQLLGPPELVAELRKLVAGIAAHYADADAGAIAGEVRDV